MLMTWKKAAAGEIIYNKCPPNASGEGGGSPRSPTPALPAHSFLAPPTCLSLHAQVWGEVGRSPASTPNPASPPVPLQGLPAAAVSSVPRAWPTGVCPASPAVSPTSTATCTCR